MSQSSYFDGFYVKWSTTVSKICLPLLSSAVTANALSGNVNSVLNILEIYYEALNSKAKNDPNTIPYLLFPSWRKSFETPLLFLGDIHPYLLTRLLRSLITRANQDSGESTDELLKKIEEIEDETGTNVSDLLDRMSKAQIHFADRFSENWVSSYHSPEKKQSKTSMEMAASMAVDYAAKEETMELVKIFVDANRLRKKLISAIVKATSKSHHLALAALFLEGLCRFYLNSRDLDTAKPVQALPSPVLLLPPNQTEPVMIQQLTTEPVQALLSPVPPDDRTLRMEDVPYYMDSGLLKSWFAQSGGVVSANVIRYCDNETGQIKRLGKIVFGTWAAANRALKLYNNTPIPYLFPIPVQVFRLTWCNKRSEYAIFVGNLNGDVTAYALGEMFRVHYQSVRAAKIAIDNETGRGRGYGFVSFSDKNEQIRALGEMDGLCFINRFMKIGPAFGIYDLSLQFSSLVWDN
ncbi:unnamed protein product [Microthlaspi erraticum]|uniref:RRM domain-containing protein n=1 Tax=Microthlaspi erraticum TaxID=1685480 RepID=A0A6D2LIM1_9BRAS|nr:unnamed protein product [Microthlaspi erraticum]